MRIRFGQSKIMSQLNHLLSLPLRQNDGDVVTNIKDYTSQQARPFNEKQVEPGAGRSRQSHGWFGSDNGTATLLNIALVVPLSATLPLSIR